MVNGYRKEVTQITRMGDVSKVVSGQGKRPILFHGAIVALSNPKDCEYDAVPSSYFKTEVPCHAKHGSHHGAVGQPATKLTGICYTVAKESTGYIKIQWHSDKAIVWIAANRVEDNFRGKRKSNTTDRFAHTVIKHARKVTLPPLKHIPLKHMKMFYSFINKNEMNKEMRKNVKSVKDLIGLADVDWRLHWAILMTNKIDRKSSMIPSAPRFPTLETCLIFNISKNNLHGSLGKDINNELSVQLPENGNDQMSPIYLDAITDWVDRKNKSQREKNCQRIGLRGKRYVAYANSLSVM